jgi:hypothetical protein
MPKRAKIVATGFEVTCPECDETIPDPEQDSLFWTIEQLRQHEGRLVRCHACDTYLKIAVPSRAVVGD